MKRPRVFQSSYDYIPGEISSTVTDPEIKAIPVSELGITFDISTPTFVEFEHENGVFFPVIPREEFEETLREFAKKNGSELQSAYARHIDAIKQWKQDSGCPKAQIHELRFKHGLDINRNTRDTHPEELSRHPTDQAKETARHLHMISKSFIDEYYGDEIQLHRGLSYKISEIIKDIFEEYSSKQEQVCPLYRVNTTVLDNFTINRKVADEYGVLRIERSFQLEDIALATDSLYYEEAREQRKTDGEMQVRGDRFSLVGAEQLYVPPNEDTTLPDILDKLVKDEKDLKSTPLSLSEHAVMIGIINCLFKDRVYLEDPDARQLLQDWLTRFFQELNKHNRNELLNNPRDDQINRIVDLYSAIANITGDEPEVPAQHGDPSSLF